MGPNDVHEHITTLSSLINLSKTKTNLVSSVVVSKLERKDIEKLKAVGVKV